MTRPRLQTTARQLRLGFAFLLAILAGTPAQSQELTVEALHNTAYVNGGVKVQRVAA